jgi:DNA-directed RNA polymerase subunit L
MVEIKNIKINKHTIDLSKTKYKELSKFIPTNFHKKISFELSKTHPGFANGLRRILTNELPMKYLTVSLTDINSDDKYIISENIQRRLEMIPINQEISEETILNIKFENNTDSYINIMSNLLKSNDCGKEIILCGLNSQCTLSISNIRVATTKGYNNGRCSLGKVCYEIINCDMSLPSLESNPTDFKISLEILDILGEPIYFIKKALDEIKIRLDNINFNNSIIEYEIYKLHLFNETHTIARLISRYIFDMIKTIDYVQPRIIHPSKREIIIDIKHPEGEKLCKSAIIEIKKDIDKIYRVLDTK